MGWEEDGLTPVEQGLRAVGVEHATREQEMQEFFTAGRSVGGFFFFFSGAPFVRRRRVIKHQNGTRPRAEMTTWGVSLQLTPVFRGSSAKWKSGNA